MHGESKDVQYACFSAFSIDGMFNLILDIFRLLVGVWDIGMFGSGLLG